MNTNSGIKLCDKIIQCRKEKGLSQEQLADYLDVSRQAVSKWESDQTTPSLDKIIQLADLFGVSIDYLVRENVVSEEKNKTVVTTLDDTLVMQQLGELKELVKTRRMGVYEYKSKRTIGGIPIVHVNFSYGKPVVAKGIFAFGNIAIGVISLGALAGGIISFGGFAFGLLFALAGFSIGGFAAGGIAVGAYAFGGLAVGMYSMGGCAIASKIAAGGYAYGNIAIGDATSGEHTFDIATASKDEVMNAIKLYYPNVPNFLARLFSAFVLK